MSEYLESDLFDCFTENTGTGIMKRKKGLDENPVDKIAKMDICEDIKWNDIGEKEECEIPIILAHTMDVECGLACTHRVSMPNSFEYQELQYTKNEAAKKYSFTLDAFQKQAILCIENNQSVIVAAHTSSGKTVVAEYAIAKCLKNHKRVIYTSPIKALSNQKYRELSEQFHDVGLQTGDVTLNPSAACIVMTTEILRSMLYRGSEIMREVAWVIFDEIHYMRDKERGVVWEETIILLPDNVRFVFLSATIPNAEQFAEWIALTHSQACHVVSTDFRPTPLQHYIIPPSGDSLYLILNENNNFMEDNLKRALEGMDTNQKQNRDSAARAIGKITKFMVERKFSPVIVFSFSKRECEYFAGSVSIMDFNDEKEKQMIEEVFNNAVSSLSAEDRNLPQISSCLPFLKRGIGIHHSGLLPILKEVTEILFSEGLIKFLFSTETFAMGLNMPARTVLFTSCRKFDGIENRFIQCSEYIQMSGRAGRRGIDDRGICILMIDNEMTVPIAKSIYRGTADPLKSAFRLTYNMILNLLRIEGIEPEYMMRKSFFQYQTTSQVLKFNEKVKVLKEERKLMEIEQESELASFVDLRNQIQQTKRECQKIIHNLKSFVRFLQPGRIVKVSGSNTDFGYGVIVRYHSGASPNVALQYSYPFPHCDILLSCTISVDVATKQKTFIPNDGKRCEANIIPVSCKMIAEVTSIVIDVPSLSDNNRLNEIWMKALKSMSLKFPDGFPLLDPVKDMKIVDETFIKLHESIIKMDDRLKSLPINVKLCKKSRKMVDMLDKFEQKLQISKEIELAEEDLKNSQSVIQLSQLKARKRILRRLGFINAADVIEMKGRVACEISSADELVLTELLFEGFFNTLSPGSINAALSCFLYQERSTVDYDEMTSSFQNLHSAIVKVAKNVARVSKECKLELNEEDYISSFKCDLMSVFGQWTDGFTFFDICTSSTIFEGSIIRCLRRLDELLKQLVDSAKCIGNAELEAKFKLCSQKIKRNIAFSASLYL